MVESIKEKDWYKQAEKAANRRKKLNVPWVVSGDHLVTDNYEYISVNYSDGSKEQHKYTNAPIDFDVVKDK